MKTIAKIIAGIFIALFAVILFFAERDRPVEELIPLYANKDSKFMPILGMKVHYRDEGVATDTLPLILLHGMSSSLNTWDSVVIDLKSHKRVISLDLPGFGLTGPSPENAYNFPYYSKFIDSFATRLKIKRFILVGNSMGGAISWNYALHNPSGLAKMVLVDAAGYPKKGESGSLGFTIAATISFSDITLEESLGFIIVATISFSGKTSAESLGFRLLTSNFFLDKIFKESIRIESAVLRASILFKESVFFCSISNLLFICFLVS